MYSLKKLEIIVSLIERLAGVYKELLILILFIILFGKDLVEVIFLMVGV